MTAALTTNITAFDGTHLAVHRMGEGAPVILLHGLFSDAQTNWVRFGHARKLVDAGFEAIMPDLRAHGSSGKPHEASAYPSDVLVRDVLTLVQALDLQSFDLVGFSLGARTAAQCVVGGLRPRKLVLSGMGLDGLAGWDGRGAFFIDAIDRFDEIKPGDPAFFAKSFMKTQNIDRIAARLLLQSVSDIAPDALSALTMRTLILCGSQDRDNGSPEKLAEALSDGQLVTIPGTHMSSVAERALGDALVKFLS